MADLSNDSSDSADSDIDEYDMPWNPEADRGSCIGTVVPKPSRKRPRNEVGPKMISVWNFKGGVGKTTTTFSIGYALARKGKKVMFVDADPQMNLTNTAIRYDLHRNDDDEQSLFTKLRELDADIEGHCNLTDAFKPVVSGQDVDVVNLIQLSMAKSLEGEQAQQGIMYLLRGSNEMMELTEVDECVGEGYREYKDNRKNYPGAIYHIVVETAKRYGCDYIVVDCCPTCTPLTRTLLFSSNSLLVPCKADGFSIQALQILSTKMKDWYTHYCTFRENTAPTAKYKLPSHDVKYAGCILVGVSDNAKSGPENSGPMKKILQDIAVAREQLEQNLPDQLKCAQATGGWAAVFPNFYQLGIIAQRSSVAAPYLPDSYLKELEVRKGRWKNMGKENRIRTTNNRERQRAAIDSLVHKLQLITEST